MTPNEAKERIEKQRSFDVAWRSVTFHLSLPPERIVRTIVREHTGNQDAIEREMLTAALVGWSGVNAAMMVDSGELDDAVPFDRDLALQWLDENLEASDLIVQALLAKWNKRTTDREDAAKNSQSASTTNEIETRHAA